MSQSTSRLPVLVAVAVALLAAVVVYRGWFGGPQRPRTVPVSGTIRYRGNPVGDADVAFITPGNSRYAIGVTDAQGRFTLGTFVPGDGALVGVHRVTVATSRGLPPVPVEGPLPQTKEEIEATMKWIEAHEAAVKAGRTGVPIRYGRGDTTPLEVTVGSEGGTFDLELTDE